MTQQALPSRARPKKTKRWLSAISIGLFVGSVGWAAPAFAHEIHGGPANTEGPLIVYPHGAPASSPTTPAPTSTTSTTTGHSGAAGGQASTTTTTVVVTSQPHHKLVFTGADVEMSALAGVSMLFLGGGLVLLVRRRVREAS